MFFFKLIPKVFFFFFFLQSISSGHFLDVSSKNKLKQPHKVTWLTNGKRKLIPDCFLCSVLLVSNVTQSRLFLLSIGYWYTFPCFPLAAHPELKLFTSVTVSAETSVIKIPNAELCFPKFIVISLD